jgi:tryptophanyl-tRNA synthetase
MKKIIFSGIRATGRLHLGNYLGMVKGMLKLQKSEEYELYFAVVDLHAMTTPYDKKTLENKTKAVVLDYLATGMDTDKSKVIVQSRVADLHAELMFYFSTVVSMARMRHLPALLNYPVLMAADILAYKGELVPVGVDQEPHLEVAREVARKMNAKYGTQLPEPRRFATKGEYVPSLAGEGKMSKSVEGSFINLTDSLEMIKKKLAGAPTDSGKGEKVPTEGGVANLLKFVELFEGKKARVDYEKEYVSKGIRYGELKDRLAQAIYKELEPIQKRRRELEKKPEYVREVIEEGVKQARKVASQTVKEVKKKMGL